MNQPTTDPEPAAAEPITLAAPVRNPQPEVVSIPITEPPMAIILSAESETETAAPEESFPKTQSAKQVDEPPTPLEGTGLSPSIENSDSSRALAPEGLSPAVTSLLAAPETPFEPPIREPGDPAPTAPTIDPDPESDPESDPGPETPPREDPDPATPPVKEPDQDPETAPSPIHASSPAGNHSSGSDLAAEPVLDPSLPTQVEHEVAEVTINSDLAHTPKPVVKLESRDNAADLSPFSVIVDQVYDGPLDLLLDLIRKQDIDIYDIPIAKITSQFLAYVNQLKAGDVDVAGEFIYIASLLIHIKSKMLLPRADTGQDDATEDPRRELVERLLEHERFKNAAQMLQQKQMLEAATWTNPGIREFKDDIAVEPEIAADTVDLVRVFRDILERARTRPVFNVDEDAVTVGQMIQFLSRRLTMEDKPIALRRLLSHTRSERALIAMFLALLELVRLQAILLRQDLAFSEIFVKKHAGFDAVINEGLASARDDWR